LTVLLEKAKGSDPFIVLRRFFLSQKEASKELETTGTETRTNLIYAESAQAPHTGMCSAHSFGLCSVCEMILQQFGF